MPTRRRIGRCIGVLGAVLATAATRDATACGACFSPPTESTQVSGHRMILSVSMQQTTLYDQLQYAGAPTSFAWVLPIRGQVQIGLSSDLLFEVLDGATTKVLQAPYKNCAPPPNCYGSAGSGGSAGGAFFDSSTGGVTVISQATVGPYETVQLASTDPNALSDWLTSHGYAIPSDMEPVIAAYVTEGFDFLALKLVPGTGVAAMRPVSVTSPGASPSLPLRMVAGGAGSTVPIILFVVGEGPWEPANFSTFRIDPASIVWDWDTSSSNYKSLVAAGFATHGGASWLYETSVDYSPSYLQNQIEFDVYHQATDYGPAVAQSSPDAGLDTKAAADADVATLFAGMNPTSVRVTRVRADLPKAALAADLSLQAPADTTQVPALVQITNTTGSYNCPSYSPCGGTGGGAGTAGGGGAAGGSPGDAPTADTGTPGASCGIGGERSASGALLGLAALLALRWRRRVR